MALDKGSEQQVTNQQVQIEQWPLENSWSSLRSRTVASCLQMFTVHHDADTQVRMMARGAPLLLWPLLLLCGRLVAAQRLQSSGLNGFSLHPPYFNLAEGTKITASATCGEDEAGRSLRDLYCKLVGGPVSGDPSQTIQKCAPGFYRDTIGLFLGKCVPCACHGHSDLCEDGSGRCVDCQHNTVGDHCETCQGGFLGNNSLDGQAVSCSSCPCPLRVSSNNFAEGCVQRSDRMQCLCMPGYAGPNCERCAPGFYGNPMVLGSRCQPCRCHGNTDPNMLFTDCHPLTGECLSCMHHTGGALCDLCAPGFYGDAISAKNCTECSCSPCGTDSCDPHTGECRCKAGVTGPRCDRCQDGSFGFDSCSGCLQCECAAAAALVTACDPLSGRCACRPGVNGPQCRQCAPGFWSYGADGCKKCECRGGRCDPRTGECRCPDGMTGKQCDVCSHKHNVLVEDTHGTHCETCDGCVLVLLEDLDKMSNNFSSVSAQLKNLNASSIAWAQLNALNQSVDDIAAAIQNYNSSLDESRSRADMLDAEIMIINDDINELQDKASVTSERVDGLQNSTTDTHQRAQDLLLFIHNLTMDINDVLLMSNRSWSNETEAEQDVEELERKMREVQAMLREMRSRSCVGQKKVADRERTQAEKLLQRVHKELADRQGQNNNLTQSIRDGLSHFLSEMMDLRDALNEAVNNTARATEVNNANEKTLEDNQRKMDDLLSQQKEVTVQLDMAEEDVAQVNDLLSTLQDSKEEYERLAAQLDGARTPLLKKVQEFAWVENRIPLVEEAEKHAALLDALASNLSSLVEETKTNRIVDVTQIYNKILTSIQEAEQAAKRAGRAANATLESVKNQDLGQIAVALRNHSVDLKDEVEKLDEELNNDLKPQLDEAERRLKEAKHKQTQVMKDLETVQNNLLFTSNVSQQILEAKAAADLANTSANQVHDALRPIREQLDQWEQTYGDVNASNDDINKALMDANQTMLELGATIPSLLTKLDVLQNQSILMPNISENINRIRELIQEARNAASKVSVPVKFNGASGVQVRTPSNLADLAAYTSLKMFITLPEGTRSRRQGDGPQQFVFYLGNKDSSKEFLGMALDGKQLHWFFNVGGETAEVTMREDVKSDGFFHTVGLERILQYGQMSMSSEATGGDQSVTKAGTEASGDQGLLNLLTDETVFYVGGYPSTFKPPPQLDLSKFKGCIELDTLNEEVLSLYNFENIFQLNTTEEKPCGRPKPVLTQAWVNDASYFDGTGFAEITFTVESPRMQRFEQEVKLLSQRGILLLLQNQNHFLCLAVLNGQLKVFYDFTDELVELDPKEPDSEFLLVSDAEPKALEVIILQGTSNRIVVRNNRVNLYIHSFTEKIPSFSGSYYLGGVPKDKIPDQLKTMFPKQGSLKGCFRNVKAYSSHVDLKRMKSSGVSFGCDGDLLVAREAHFSGQSFLDLALTNVPSLRDNFYVSFSFRTDKKEGLMFYHQDKDGECEVLLNEGRVVVRADKREMVTLKTYNDANSHYVSIYINSTGMRLYMDDVLEKGKEGIRINTRGRSPLTSGVSTFLGGTPDQTSTNLTGCISNVFIKRDTSPQAVQNLLKVNKNVNVPLGCPAAAKPQQILAAQPKHNKAKKHKKPSGSRSRNTRESCQGAPSDQESGATHFSGSAHSHQRYDALPRSLSSMPHVSMSLRINSSEGLVLQAGGGPSGGAVLSLSVSGGRLLLLLDAGKRKLSLRSRRKYDDDRWHTVFVKREGQKLVLIVDGIDAQSKKLPGGDRARVAGPLYVGGAPPTLMAPGGFTGCVKDLRLNEAPAGSPSYSQGAVPCFQNPLQPGAYFSGEGGHMALDESLVLGRDLEIQLEVRPVSDSGLLLHAGTSADQHLSLVLSQGEVTVSVKSGKGEFSASFTPEEPLCNGHWHTITVVKKNNVLQLHVDAASELSVGPRQSRTAGGKEGVYLGGKPGGATVPGLPAFHGCIRSVSVNHRAAVLSKPLSVHGAVGTRGCPVV
ncbi:laminin subunit alpha-5 [Pleuronectes platessa]|uniref:laminin subunit alpha-5 n=1 Tax=Pleuronectes platessa TaxID=8262 RepID=UPI00232A7956|nr:laminin subunit alpha-5 [Pleuronectes platessa]